MLDTNSTTIERRYAAPVKSMYSLLSTTPQLPIAEMHLHLVSVWYIDYFLAASAAFFSSAARIAS